MMALPADFKASIILIQLTGQSSVRSDILLSRLEVINWGSLYSQTFPATCFSQSEKTAGVDGCSCSQAVGGDAYVNWPDNTHDVAEEPHARESLVFLVRRRLSHSHVKIICQCLCAIYFRAMLSHQPCKLNGSCLQSVFPWIVFYFLLVCLFCFVSVRM